MSNYEDILNRSWDNIPKDQLLPEGSWLLRGQNATFQKAKTEDQSDRFLFVYQVKEPMSDVDAQALQSLGDFDITSKQVFFTLFVQRPKDWDIVRAHLAKHGVPVSGVSIQDSLKAFKGTEVIAYLGTKTFTSKQTGEVVTDNDPTVFEPVA